MQNKDVIYSASAEKDLKEIYNYYEEKQLGLGLRFISSFETSIAHIDNNNLIGQKITNNIRKFGLKLFPFILYYRITDNAIEIIGCFHVRRDPNYVRKRME